MKNGDYVDEKIIQIRRFCQIRTKSHDLLTSELFIRGKPVRFIPVFIFDKKVRVMMPKTFIEMPEMIAKVRYISSYRPPIIMTSTSYDENIGFHLLQRENNEGEIQLDQLIKKMQDTILLHAPETVLYEQGEFLADNAEGRWFEYKNFTLDDETYNLQFLISSDSYLLAGSFNCRMFFYDEWKNPVLESLEYIKFEGKEER